MNIGALLCLILLQVLGSLLSQLLIPAIPGAIIGMVLLVLGLMVVGRVPAALERTSSTLLGYLPLLLVVPASGIVLSHERLMSDAVPLVLALTGSLLVTIPLCGWLLQWLVRRQESR